MLTNIVSAQIENAKDRHEIYRFYMYNSLHVSFGTFDIPFMLPFHTFVRLGVFHYTDLVSKQLDITLL